MRGFWVCAALVLAGGLGIRLGAQVQFSRGQNVAPVFEGWERNPDGTYSLVFGYLNRNYEEQVDIPLGSENSVAVGSEVFGDKGAHARSAFGVAQVPMARRLELLASVAEAVAAAHSIGILHKDLKPANLLVSGADEVRITGFGLSSRPPRERAIHSVDHGRQPHQKKRRPERPISPSNQEHRNHGRGHQSETREKVRAPGQDVCAACHRLHKDSSAANDLVRDRERT